MTPPMVLMMGIVPAVIRVGMVLMMVFMVSRMIGFVVIFMVGFVVSLMVCFVVTFMMGFMMTFVALMAERHFTERHN